MAQSQNFYKKRSYAVYKLSRSYTLTCEKLYYVVLSAAPQNMYVNRYNNKQHKILGHAELDKLIVRNKIQLNTTCLYKSSYTCILLQMP